MFEYDDEIAVKFIQNFLPMELKEKFPEDTLYHILDVIFEFYENTDWLDNEDEELEERELIQFIIKQSEKYDFGQFADEEIRLVLAAESAYCDTLDLPDE